MSTTSNILTFLSHLQSINTVEERRCCLMMFLCKTEGPYLTPIKKTIRQFGSIRTRQIKPKFSHCKYKIFITLLAHIQSKKGFVEPKVIHQLRSDCADQNELDEFTYHLYKTPLPNNLIVELISLYQKYYNDFYFLHVVTHLAGNALVKHQKSLKGNELHFVVSCNRTKDVFYTTADMLNWNNCKTVKVANSYRYRTILANLKRYVDTSFIVNNSNIKNLGTFILGSDKIPLRVEIYNNKIIEIHVQ